MKRKTNSIAEEPKSNLWLFLYSWEQRKLIDVAEKVTEKNTTRLYTETFTNSAEHGVVSQRDFFDHDVSKAGSINGYYVVRENDFVYNPRISTTAPCGPINCNRLGRAGVISPLYTVFRTHDIDTYFLEWYFKSSSWHSFMYFNGDTGARSDRFSIKNELFFSMPIHVPTMREQQKISKTLIHLDALITLHQRNKTSIHLRHASTPEQNRNAWEQRKLGEITKVLSASRVHKEEWASDGVPFFRSSDVVSAFKGNNNDRVYISQELYEELIKSSGKLQQGDILITGGGSIGIPYIVPDNEPLYSKDADLIWIKKSTKHDSHYLYTYFISPKFRDYISGISHIGTIAHYTIEQVEDTPIPLPNMAEQEVIGSFFCIIDTLITLHQRKP